MKWQAGESEKLVGMIVEQPSPCSPMQEVTHATLVFDR